MERFKFDSDPIADKKSVIIEGDLRITVLTSRLVRVEKGDFTDEATQTVWFRNFPQVKFSLVKTKKTITVKTNDTEFEIDLLYGRMKSVTLKCGKKLTKFGVGNLLGTVKTLDRVNGKTKLEKGIMSRNGVTALDDSKGLVLLPSGEIKERRPLTDVYYFAYGTAYLDGLKDFFALTGKVPLIPKFALGNWWSRYHKYTQEEYLTLMEKFRESKLPFTVATVDMDWHYVDVVSRFGKDAIPQKVKENNDWFFRWYAPGWTGYTWNTELFSDHKKFLKELHEMNMKVTLNVHPANGARFFEDGYDGMKKALGKGNDFRGQLSFDASDPNYVAAYLDFLHHDKEEEGVDFWWIDWQQGNKSKIKGLDPLWALNHYHTLDIERGTKRGIILSRYAGLGSHRYPLGFSGDTFRTWKSLDFQPYFTVNAANVGYTWWSHDIGGHQFGKQDDELYLRWLQLGVFSPVNRLHSSADEFMGKEPWKKSYAVEKLSESFLRLRHRLIPYIYTANYKTHSLGVPLCEPMYYEYDSEEAYKVKNEYMFGSELLVCPITEKADKLVHLAEAEVWLPKGRWTDVFNGRIYEGGKKLRLYRDLDSIPVLAKQGAIVPMYLSGETNDLSLSQAIEINVWRGNNTYEMYDDDGESKAYNDGHFAKTLFEINERGDEICFTIDKPVGDLSILPEKRDMKVVFRDVVGGKVFVDGKETESEEKSFVAVTIPFENEKVEIRIEKVVFATNKNMREELIGLLTRVSVGEYYKMHRYTPVVDNPSRAKGLPKAVREAVEEIASLKYE